MQSLLFNPYWHALGGSERVFVSMAHVLAERGHVRAVASTLPDPALQERLGFPDLGVEVISEISDVSRASAGLDLFACVTNAPPPAGHAMSNIACIAFPFLPFSPDPQMGAFERRWLARYRCFVYSDFARTWTYERWGVQPDVISPPVNLRSFEPSRKERLVLAVGRFFEGGHNKRHDLVLETFAGLPSEVRSGWRLVLAGGAMDDDASQRYVEEIRRAAADAPIDVVVNASAEELDVLYSRASIFVHATGFGRAPDEPERAEHFGIVTVEAMSAGAVPLSFADGGQVEIVSPGSGYLWSTKEQLAEQLAGLMQDAGLVQRMAAEAARASNRFSEERFRAEFGELVDDETERLQHDASLRERFAAALRDRAELEEQALTCAEDVRAMTLDLQRREAEVEALRAGRQEG